jgi:hypothetical protein
MKSPGAPSLRRDVERAFWREIATGFTSEEAQSRSARRRRLVLAGSGSVAVCLRSA